MHRAAKLEVVESARSDGERGRGGQSRGVLPGGGALALGGGIALSFISRQLQYVPPSFRGRRFRHWHVFGCGESSVGVLGIFYAP